MRLNKHASASTSSLCIGHTRIPRDNRLLPRALLAFAQAFLASPWPLRAPPAAPGWGRCHAARCATPPTPPAPDQTTAQTPELTIVSRTKCRQDSERVFCKLRNKKKGCGGVRTRVLPWRPACSQVGGVVQRPQRQGQSSANVCPEMCRGACNNPAHRGNFSHGFAEVQST